MYFKNTFISGGLAKIFLDSIAILSITIVRMNPNIEKTKLVDINEDIPLDILNFLCKYRFKGSC